MWAAVNEIVKRYWPSAHAWAKRQSAGWRLGPDPPIPVPKRIGGEFFWVHPRLLMADTRDREPHICNWVLRSLSAGGTFFDVGAHYGWISLRAARRVGRHGRVVAFEAAPVLVDILKYHQRRNRLPQMRVIGSAVADTDARRTDFYLLYGGLSSRNSLTITRDGLPYLDPARKSKVEVPTLKLDTFCGDTGWIPEVIKIDVEGAEGMVLRGASAILRRFHPVLVVSLHPYWLPPPDSTRTVLEFAKDCGYRVQASHVVRFDGHEIGDYLLTP